MGPNLSPPAPLDFRPNILQHSGAFEATRNKLRGPKVKYPGEAYPLGNASQTTSCSPPPSKNPVWNSYNTYVCIALTS